LSSDGLAPQRLYLGAGALNCRDGSSRLDRIATRHFLLDILDAAAAAAGLSALAWLRQDGDTELAELPVDEQRPRVADRFLGELDAELFRHNVTRQRAARLRVRAAIHCGQTAGLAAHLVNAVTLHEAMRLCPEANLGVLLSAGVFDTTVTTQRPEWLRKVRAAGHGTVWLLMPGHNVHDLALHPTAYPLPAARARSS
jgi:hypothetical protein